MTNDVHKYMILSYKTQILIFYNKEITQGEVTNCRGDYSAYKIKMQMIALQKLPWKNRASQISEVN